MQANEPCFHTDLCNRCAERFDALDDDPLPWRPPADRNPDPEDNYPLGEDAPWAINDMPPDRIKWDALKKAVEDARKERGN
jgi:hypothetical protein